MVAACGSGPAPPPPARPYEDAGFAEAGGHRLHYALTPTQDLPPEIARSYGIDRRRDLALLTATIAPRDTAEFGSFEDAKLEATAIALTGVRTPLELTRRIAPASVTWLATVEIRHRVPVTIELRAHATESSPEIRARLTREFRLD